MDAPTVVILAIAACVLIPLAIVILILAWPFLACAYFGHPVIGIVANILWLAVLNN